jgi:uncharacterized membrane protein HdeD (DUF308 family)
VVREQTAGVPWWAILLLGIISVLFGVIVLVWPRATLHVLAVLVGFWLLFAGLVRIFSAFLPGPGVGRQVLSGIVGVILVVGGAACLRNVVNALAILALMVALTWIFSGVAEIILAFQTTGGGRIALLAVGVLALIAGFVFLFSPGLSLAALVLMVGITAIVIGIGEVLLSFQLRKVQA